MAIVTTARGTQVDISTRIFGNMNAGPLLESPIPYIGNTNYLTAPPPTPGANVIPPIQWGNWFKVPDNQFKRVRENPTPVIGAFSSHIEWTLPNGSRILLTYSGDVRFTQEFFVWPPFATVENCYNVSIRLSRTTMPGLIDNGIITQQQADVLLGVQRSVPITGGNSPTAANVGNSTSRNPSAGAVINNVADTAQTGFRALIVVALVVAAIYYIPRTGGLKVA